MPYVNEADLTSRFIRILRDKGWTDDLLREEPAFPAYQRQIRPDAALYIRPRKGGQPLLGGVIELKAANRALLQNATIEQVARYARELHVPIGYLSNGEVFHELDFSTEQPRVSRALPVADFPSPKAFTARYESVQGFQLDSSAAKPLTSSTVPPATRYYQESAIRAVLEAIAQGQTRILVQMAPGTGKHFTVSNLLKRLETVSQLGRVLVLADNVKLRTSWVVLLERVFDVHQISAGVDNPVLNKDRVFVADSRYFASIINKGSTNLAPVFSPNFFGYIVVVEPDDDESGWTAVLEHSPNSTQLAFVSHPTAKLLEYFGKVSYSYTISRAVQDNVLVHPPQIETPDALTVTDSVVPAENPQDPKTGQPISDTELRQGYSIFISYRRDDSASEVDKIHNYLVKHFDNKTVFRDISSIQLGEDFVQAIDDAVRSCLVVLVVIGRHWLRATDANGKRRLDNPKDFVRREIQAALKNNVRVIPILVNRADMPSEVELPRGLRKLARFNAHEIVQKDKYFHSEMQELVEKLDEVLKIEIRKRT